MSGPQALRCRIGSLELDSPLLTGSGTFGHDGLVTRFLQPGDLGALVIKTVTPAPRGGNPPPRLVETPAGLLNSIGLENRGVDAFIAETVPLLRELSKPPRAIPVVANAGGESVDEYVHMVRSLDRTEAFAAIEVNLSCPNVQGGALPFATSAEAVARVIEACRSCTERPLWAKLSPNVARLGPIAQAAERAGADALTVANTLLGLVVDWRRRRPVLGAGFGGLSGPAIRPVAMRMVWEARQAVDLPIVASGGAATAEDVMEFVTAGASAVQIGTAGFQRPDLISRIAADLRALLKQEGTDLESQCGSLQWPSPAASGKV
ncbi:MAG: dihydroorotate dehydrogenase [Planctomycetota bacterium]|nr:MAG: dihydroorotate dehydrogenase [Planctomycetota bacterium]